MTDYPVKEKESFQTKKKKDGRTRDLTSYVHDWSHTGVALEGQQYILWVTKTFAFYTELGVTDGD